jgi:phosphoenolpyruvate carboxylase
LPGWFGLGCALQAMAAEAGGWQALRHMQASWPFFDTLLFNAALCLQQVDLDIAAYYVKHLHPDARASQTIFSLIQQEHRLTHVCLQQLLGDTYLQDTEPGLQTSIDLKAPYLDPLNYIQVLLLQRYRQQFTGADKALEAPALKEAFESAIMSSITGIAIGLGTTG